MITFRDMVTLLCCYMHPLFLCHRMKHNGQNFVHFLAGGNKTEILRDVVNFLLDDDDSPLYWYWPPHYDDGYDPDAADGHGPRPLVEEWHALATKREALEWIQDELLNVQANDGKTPADRFQEYGELRIPGGPHPRARRPSASLPPQHHRSAGRR